MKYGFDEQNEYCIDHTSEAPDYLSYIERDSHLNVLMGHMISDFVGGRFLSMVSKLKKPKRILEVGTFTGYATLCLAEGLDDCGKIDTIEKNLELKKRLEYNISLSPYKNNIKISYGDAKTILPHLKGGYDLVFLDAYKRAYLDYYQLIKPLMNKGAILIADNVLWNEKVYQVPPDKRDKDTEALINFNRFVQKDPEVINNLLPFADGFMIVEKL